MPSVAPTTIMIATSTAQDSVKPTKSSGSVPKPQATMIQVRYRRGRGIPEITSAPTAEAAPVMPSSSPT